MTFQPTDDVLPDEVGTGSGTSNFTSKVNWSHMLIHEVGNTALGILPPYVTELPTSPADGDEVYFAADPDDGVIWHLRYRAAATGSYKWDFIGGPEMEDYFHSGQNITSATWYNPTDPLSITLPLAGDYDITVEAQMMNTTASAMTFYSYRIDSGADDSGRGIISGNDDSSDVGDRSKTRRIRSQSAGSVLSDRVSAESSTGYIQTRRLSLKPTRVG